MMSVRTLASVLLLAALAASPASAQLAGPAETPPETFRGDQYVDSAGCIFIRTGIEDRTRWVPRVTRTREPICGARPSPAVAAAAPVLRRTPAAAAPRAREVQVAAPADRVAAPAPTPIRTAATPAARPGCGTSALLARFIPGCAPDAARPVPASQPKTVASTAPFAIPRGMPVTRAAAPTDPLAGARRIDPATPSPLRRSATPRRAARSDLDLSTGVIVPPARTTFDVRTPPPGYRAAWSDGRLNAHRGPQTLLGDYQSRIVWTTTTPRRARGVFYTRN